MTRASLSAIACLAALAAASPLAAQDARAVRLEALSPGLMVPDGSLSDVVFANAPFSAEAVTTVTQTLNDGTKIEQRTTARWYRDSAGRVRREQTVIGLDRLDPSAQPQTTITFDSVPGDPQPYALDPTTRTARRAPRGVRWLTFGNGSYLFSSGNGGVYRLRTPGVNAWAPAGFAYSVTYNAGSPYEGTLARAGAQAAPVPTDLQPTEEQLGTRQIEGVKATGRRSTTVIPAGRIGNDRPIQIVEEQWEAPELNMVVLSRFADPRTGVVEYRLTNITRAEPPADLFTVPSDYTVVDPTTAYRDAITGGGARGQRGGRGN